MNTSTTMLFGDLKVGDKFFDPWTRSRYLKVDDDSAVLLAPQATKVKYGYKATEIVQPLFE
jgi:hypothetical protein